MFHDLNADGQYQFGEPPLAGATLTLKNASQQVLATYVTTETGTFGFPGLTPGFYFVVETDPPGFRSVTGSSNNREINRWPAVRPLQEMQIRPHSEIRSFPTWYNTGG